MATVAPLAQVASAVSSRRTRLSSRASVAYGAPLAAGPAGLRPARRLGACAAVAQAAPAAAAAPASTSFKQTHTIGMTLTTWLLKMERVNKIDNELAIVLSSVALACKQIAALVQRAGITNLTGKAGATNVQGEDQKKLDVISDEIFSACLRDSGRTGVIASEEQDVPIAVLETGGGEYVVVFDPLDGSSNLDAAVSTGSIFGVYEATSQCVPSDSDIAVQVGHQGGRVFRRRSHIPRFPV